MPNEQALSVVIIDRDDESRRIAESNILRNPGLAREGKIGPFSDRTGFIDSQ